jgi:hypothetical protein
MTDKVKRGFNLHYCKHKYCFATEYEFQGGGAYGVDLFKIIEETDREGLAKVIAHLIDTPPTVVDDWSEIPKPQNEIFRAAGFRTHAAYDKASAVFSITVYAARTMIYFRPMRISPREGFTEEVEIKSVKPRAIADWLINNKALYAHE